MCCCGLSAARLYTVASSLTTLCSIFPSLHSRCSKEIKACHLDIIHYKGDALGWRPQKSLTLNAEHVSLHVLLNGNIEEDRIYILKIVSDWDIQDVFVQTSHLAHLIYKIVCILYTRVKIWGHLFIILQ